MVPAGQEDNVIEVWACESDLPDASRAERRVTFTIPARSDIETAAVVGDFNDWSESATPMTARDETFTATVILRVGQRYRFKYLLNGELWENDWAADDYVPNGSGGDDSVLDLGLSSSRAHLPEERTIAHSDRPGRPMVERVLGGFETDRRALAEFVRVWRDDAVRRRVV